MNIRAAGLFFVFLLLSAASHAQNPVAPPGSSPTDQLSQLYKEEYQRKREIKLDGKKYRIYNNYVTMGFGPGYNSAWKQMFVATGFDFNFHIQKARFQLGTYLQGQNFHTKQQIQLHAAYGYRKESYKYFWAVYGGPSYSIGSYPVHFKSPLTAKDTTTYPIMKEVGLYAALQAFYKLKFDYGIGVTLFGDVNSKQYMIGARVELFFSGAYRGTVIRKEE